jgi:hypothetical protein
MLGGEGACADTDVLQASHGGTQNSSTGHESDSCNTEDEDIAGVIESEAHRAEGTFITRYRSVRIKPNHHNFMTPDYRGAARAAVVPYIDTETGKMVSNLWGKYPPPECGEVGDSITFDWEGGPSRRSLF